VIHIQVDLKPVPKARPRFNPRSGRPYTPQTTQDFESHVSFFARRVVEVPLESGVHVQIIFKFIKAKSSKLNLHTKKPDIDNLIKSVLDGLNGVAFKDDSQIVKLESEKIFADRDGVDIYIQEIISEEKEPVTSKRIRKKV
jgi:crossover junction endodeoxyribonuclease RusA